MIKSFISGMLQLCFELFLIFIGMLFAGILLTGAWYGLGLRDGYMFIVAIACAMIGVLPYVVYRLNQARGA